MQLTVGSKMLRSHHIRAATGSFKHAMWTESGDITTRLDQCVTLSCTGVDLCGDKSSSLLSLRVSINHIQQANLTHRVWVQLTLHFRPMDPCDWLTIVQSVWKDLFLNMMVLFGFQSKISHSGDATQSLWLSVNVSLVLNESGPLLWKEDWCLHL